MLHLVTPLYHFDLLKKVYKTIPPHADIIWHIAVSSQREKVPYNFVYNDPRIKLYEVDCADNDTTTKRNVVFENINEGFFYLLDDDTVFMPQLYELYLQVSAEGFNGMVVGNQKHYCFKNNLKHAIYPTADPETTHIDSGMVLCYYTVLSKVRWKKDCFPRDYTFWSNCYSFFADEKTKTVNQTISIYNALGLIKINKRFLFFRIKFNITSFRLARWFIWLRTHLRKLKIIKENKHRLM